MIGHTKPGLSREPTDPEELCQVLRAAGRAAGRFQKLAQVETVAEPEVHNLYAPGNDKARSRAKRHNTSQDPLTFGSTY